MGGKEKGREGLWQPGQASMAARRLAAWSRLSEYQTHRPRFSPWTSAASHRIFRWWEIVG